MKFEELGFNNILLKNIKEENYDTLTNIQESVIPLIMNKKDVVGIAQTGTGKTAAFVLPIIENLLKKAPTKDIKVLVLSPTRELAIQTRDTFRAFTKDLTFKTGAILGGVSSQNQIKMLKKGLDIVVSTPGRLLDLINQKKINLSQASVLVIDEADLMLDMGFINDVKKIINLLPKQRQTLLFSATMEKEITKLTKEFMQMPITIQNESTKVPTIINQEVYYIDKDNKINLLFDLLNTKDKPSTLIFTRTKIGADKLEQEFNNYDIKVSVIHGDKRQSNRAKALQDFKLGKTNILIATDVASRGIDIQGLKQVINYDVPDFAEDYIHRIGRTGRAGEIGKSITFCTHSELYKLRQIEKLINAKITEINHNYPMTKKKEYSVSKKYNQEKRNTYLNSDRHTNGSRDHHNQKNNNIKNPYTKSINFKKNKPIKSKTSFNNKKRNSYHEK